MWKIVKKAGLFKGARAKLELIGDSVLPVEPQVPMELPVELPVDPKQPEVPLAVPVVPVAIEIPKIRSPRVAAPKTASEPVNGPTDGHLTSFSGPHRRRG